MTRGLRIFGASRLPVVLVAIGVFGVCDAYAQQFGGRYSRPSSFSPPSTRLGAIGGRYSGRTYATSNFSSLGGSYDLGGSLDNTLQTTTGSKSYGGFSGGRALSPAQPGLSPSLTGQTHFVGVPMYMAAATPITRAWAIPLGTSTPGYSRPLQQRANTLFAPTITAESFLKPRSRTTISLDEVSPEGPTAGAVADAMAAQAEPLGDATSGGQETSYGFLSTLTADKMSGDARDSLEKARSAYEAQKYRDAIGHYRRARLLLQDDPEPVLGMMASYVAVADYRQAAALIGPVVRRWPQLLNEPNPFARFYTEPGQMRVAMVRIREEGLRQGDMSVRLLWVLYSWFAESRQIPPDVQQAAQVLGPNSVPGQMVAAMQGARAGSGR